MLRSLKQIEQYKLGASDGEIGKVVDFYFDDQRWVIRYLVADTGGFFDDRRVLISPIAFGTPDWTKRLFTVDLSKDKIKNSPDVDLNRPVSRQYERDYHGYYGWPYYWGFGGAGYWGGGYYPQYLATHLGNQAREQEQAKTDPNLRSVREVTGYHVMASDGTLGHLQDFILDDETWALRYMVVDTSNWWFGKSVLVAPQWVERVSLPERTVQVAMTRSLIKTCPAWTPETVITRDYEARLFDHYDRPGYWHEEEKARSQRRPSRSGVDGSRISQTN